MIRRPPRSTLSSSSAASDVYKRQLLKMVHFFGPPCTSVPTTTLVLSTYADGRSGAFPTGLYGNACLPAYLQRSLQSVLNATAWHGLSPGMSRPYHLRSDEPPLVASSRAYHVQSGNADVQSFARYRAAILRTTCLRPRLVCFADVPSQKALRSDGSDHLVMSTDKLSTVGGRAFSAATPRVWNMQHDNVVSRVTSPVTQNFLFQQS